MNYIFFLRWDYRYQGALYYVVTGEDSIYYYNDNTLKKILTNRYLYPCGGGVITNSKEFYYYYTYNNSGDLILKKCQHTSSNQLFYTDFTYEYNQWHNSKTGKKTGNWFKAEINPTFYLELYSQKKPIYNIVNLATVISYYASYKTFITPIDEVSNCNSNIEIFLIQHSVALLSIILKITKFRASW